MKKLVLFALLATFACGIHAQTKTNTTPKPAQPQAPVQQGVTREQLKQALKESQQSLIDHLDEYVKLIMLNQDRNATEQDRYKFYPTENIYNFLLLDTKTGKIDQVQWSLESGNEGSLKLNEEDLSISSGSCFELYPTKNMYQFLLLDKKNGRSWHVQWGFEKGKRWIQRIW